MMLGNGQKIHSQMPEPSCWLSPLLGWQILYEHLTGLSMFHFYDDAPVPTCCISDWWRIFPASPKKDERENILHF